MRVTRREPIKAWLVMEAIKEETRQRIIELLLEKGELSLTEIQKFVGKTLPTLLFHMNILEKAGIISWKSAKREKKTTKVYFIKTKILSVEIDIEIFSKISNIKKLEELVTKTVEKFLEEGRELKRDLSISEISEIMNVDYNTALVIKDYIQNFDEEIVKYLYNKFKEEIAGIKDPLEISEKLKIDLYWAAKLLQYT